MKTMIQSFLAKIIILLAEKKTRKFAIIMKTTKLIMITSGFQHALGVIKKPTRRKSVQKREMKDWAK